MDELKGTAGGRMPTRHELKSGHPWDDSYAHGPAPWEIGGPQPAFIWLLAEGRASGRVLDVGCGTGELTLFAASLGLEVTGVDVAARALNTARRSATQRGLTAEFVHADALELATLGTTFDAILDCGLFHSFVDGERSTYAESLASVTRTGTMMWLLCFSDEGYDVGPHPVSQTDLHTTFNEHSGWRIERITPKRILTLDHARLGYPAWMATIERI